MPKVSVIIPNYNHGPYLSQRIDSVLNQAYQNFEIILLDDCSTDNSQEVLESYQSHVKVSHVVFNESNSGSTFRQWNKGIELAKGSLIWIAESDDWCEPSFLENLVPPLVQNTDVVVSYCSSLNIRENDIESMSLASNYFAIIAAGEEWRKLNLLDEMRISNASAAVFKRSAIVDVDFNHMQSYKLIGDRFFWYQLAKEGKVFASAKFLNYCRRHNKNVTENKNREGIGFLEYLHFLNTVKGDLCFNKEVELHIKTKILNNFLYMEGNQEFVTLEARDKVFEAINEFMPDFNSQYKKAVFKQRISKVKDHVMDLLSRKH